MTSEEPAGDLRALAAEFAAAIVSNDADRIASFIGPEWRLVDADGVTTREQFLDVVRSGRLTHSRMHAVGDVDVRRYGPVGIVLARVVNTAHLDGRTYEADEWTTDVFVRSGDAWHCVHSHVTPAA
ncbi:MULTISPECIES: nuclear transport factor 2 family protein [unclassified Microbacterium]|uniref:nuclear transport factor 2 family protein n=1 Tax=unclassified Microbacterium TaxID=2609290 RepID=UPI00214C1EA4|nr:MULTISPECIES: nuclear transport factor 2 family protein [unclassified Microbacterium]MCR2783228.1 nuclear transport factor 2 family protein [Microbacterium sp. zg.B96]MDL5351988.1 nuclear transport factor 2 family protein [Microbacterium sp. zg-YB36]WIM17667.1 nuclear transport factor 2 family protein [Microbacterium sp. zg-B96]